MIDMHSDILFDVVRQRDLGRRDVIRSDYGESFKKGGVTALVTAIYVDQALLPEQALRHALDQVAALLGEIDDAGGEIVLCRSAADLDRARASGALGTILAFEGVEPLHGDLNLLDVFHALGLRCLSLTHSRPNAAGEGAAYGMEDPRDSRGLTAFGEAVIDRAQRLRILIDLSHLNEGGFWEVLDRTSGPVILSHSNARALCPTLRNVTDRQIRAVAERGGVIGLNCVNGLVKDFDADLDDFVAQIEYVRNLAGGEHVGLGLDFSDRLFQYLSPAERKRLPPFAAVKGLEDHGRIPDLVAALKRRGWSDDAVDALLEDNFVRVFREVVG
mgnify:CR=1 FL=1